MPYPTDPIILVGIWTTTILTMFFYSYVLYKESGLFRITEYTFVASSVGLLLVTMVKVVIQSCIRPIMAGAYGYILLFVLGVLMYLRFSPKYIWISRWPFAIVVGVGLGLEIRRALTSDVIANVRGTIFSMVGKDLLTTFNNLIITVGVVCTLVYFTFTKEHIGPLKIPARLGRWFLLIMFGTYFGSMAIGRYSLLLDRINDILRVIGLLPY